jgi:hypothetical protein
MLVKVASKAGERRIFFYTVAATGGFVWGQKEKFPEVEQKLSSHINERWQFHYVVSSEMCKLQTLEIMK